MHLNASGKSECTVDRDQFPAWATFICNFHSSSDDDDDDLYIIRKSDLQLMMLMMTIYTYISRAPGVWDPMCLELAQGQGSIYLFERNKSPISKSYVIVVTSLTLKPKMCSGNGMELC